MGWGKKVSTHWRDQEPHTDTRADNDNGPNTCHKYHKSISGKEDNVLASKEDERVEITSSVTRSEFNRIFWHELKRHAMRKPKRQLHTCSRLHWHWCWHLYLCIIATLCPLVVAAHGVQYEMKNISFLKIHNDNSNQNCHTNYMYM